MGSEDAPPPAAGAWSAIARKDAVVPVKAKVEPSAVRCKSGLNTVVVDTNAVIGSGMHLVGIAERFVTMREVLKEVRDPMSRMNLAALPIKLEIMEPDPEAVTKVVRFAKATGDLQSLSEVDTKLIALAYTLESQIHGVSHLRTRPPPLQVTPVLKNKPREPLGWGSNVPNLKEWEELEEAEKSQSKINQSRILGLKYLNLDGSESGNSSPVVELESANLPSDPGSNESEIPSTARASSRGETNSEGRGGWSKREPKAPKLKPTISIEGKKNVAVGLDASKSELAEADTSGWVHACSRTTRNKFLKRQAKREAKAAALSESSSVAGDHHPTEMDVQPQRSFFEGEVVPPPLLDEDENEDVEDLTEECIKNEGDTDPGEEQDEGATANLEIESAKVADEGKGASDSDEGDEGDEEDDTKAFEAEMAAHAASGEGLQTDENESSAISDANGVARSTEAEKRDSSWQSSVACATGDFAMQNVILQMGLRLLSPNGAHVRELNRWVLKCTACNNITAEVGRIFCPKCGNGGTLYKVSVTVGANGTVHAGKIKRVNIRGTRYSLPMPKGGRIGAAQNPILREDQLPHRVLYPKQKKSSHAGGDVYVTADTLFTNNKGMQNIGLMPAVQQASAVFSGRRNPNERRNNRKH
ncbi:RNA-binding NOB1-like protein [Physcomitrium patens]|uniref:PIN domain-containing protein n=1 Tax=Physcomitrium patens TaxID=3218 RepID=A0A2K1L480_PHYPA|nr:uncharacterized protein LOC112279117 [Physcomitrium patens]PNR60830.1 hypothetical protein PHYPA_003623 [Physcomitrium patens]|eukprot:XP_024369020.1 uncharacterized protein LOC112279117 [Physcomitrella patens]